MQVNLNALVLTQRGYFFYLLQIEHDQKNEEEFLKIAKINSKIQNKKSLTFDLDFWKNLENFQAYKTLNNIEQETYNNFMKNYLHN